VWDPETDVTEGVQVQPRTFFTNVAEVIKQGRAKSQRKTATSFLPLNSQVLILPVRDDKLTDGGIIIPDTAVPKPSEGTVMAVGPGRYNEAGRLIPCTVRPGDTVLFGKYAGTEYKLCGEDMRLMIEEEILGVIR
jgi:chaperonin GroES